LKQALDYLTKTPKPCGFNELCTAASGSHRARRILKKHQPQTALRAAGRFNRLVILKNRINNGY
jgi:hypothetical protein